MNSFNIIGFIGLGVMGEPICRNLALKSGAKVVALDLDPEPLRRLAQDGVESSDAASLMARCDVVFLSLPSGEVVDTLCREQSGLLSTCRAGQLVVDLSTSAVDTTRALAAEFQKRGAVFADAPVARTRAAAEAGTLSVMVGTDAATFEQLKPLIACFATDIALCGPVGCGQVVKILNNMVMFETVLALSEAKAIGERAGVEPRVLFDALADGSADSFALRNHGMKSILPGVFPERAFSVRYAWKDLGYALKLASETGVDARGARVVDQLFSQAVERGLGEQYHPVISRMLTEVSAK